MRQRHVGEEAVQMLAHAEMWERNRQWKEVEVGEQGREGRNERACSIYTVRETMPIQNRNYDTASMQLPGTRHCTGTCAQVAAGPRPPPRRVSLSSKWPR